MSTKIYDAYKLNIEANPSYASVCEVMDKIKEIAYRSARKQFVEQMLRTAIFAFDIKNVVGEEKLDEIIEKAKSDSQAAGDKEDKLYWESRGELYESVKKAEELSYVSILYLIEMVSASWKTQSKTLFPKTASILVFPHGGDVLAMLFGNRDVLNTLDSSEYLLDYHYQDQCEKPDNISDEEWEKRKKDWDETIGPDYIPNRHGMKVELVDLDYISENLFFREKKKMFEIEGLELPTIKQRISHLADYMDCPVKKTDEMGYTEFSDLYDEWKTSLQLEEKLPDITLGDIRSAWEKKHD